jgi:hypothetical protein
MNQRRDLTWGEAWEKMPAARRHFYFFTLLFLVTVVMANFQRNVDTFKRMVPGPALPPRITSHEVYPAPVHL